MDDFKVELDHDKKTALLSVGAWEVLIDYERAHEVTEDSEIVQILKDNLAEK